MLLLLRPGHSLSSHTLVGVEWEKHGAWRIQLVSDVIAITYCVVELEILLSVLGNWKSSVFQGLLGLLRTKVY